MKYKSKALKHLNPKPIEMTDEKKKQIKLEFELDLIIKKVETAKQMLAKGYEDALFLKAGEIETVAQNMMKILDPHMYEKCNS